MKTDKKLQQEDCNSARRAEPASQLDASAQVLPELPRPLVTYADHSYPAYSKAQMAQYARAAIEAYIKASKGGMK